MVLRPRSLAPCPVRCCNRAIDTGAAAMRLSRLLPIRASIRLPVVLLPAVLGTALLASAPLAAQQVYKWKDAAGVTHFTADPPPQGQHYEAREVDHHEAVPQAAQSGSDSTDANARPDAAEDPGCATARGNLELLKGKSKVMVDSNGDGKPDKPLADADRAKQRQLAEATIAVKCSGDAPAQAAEPEEQ